MSQFARTLLALAAASLLALVGCAASAVPAASTAVPSPGADSASVSPSVLSVSDAWWRDFGSAELDTLIERALQANRDLRIGAARLAQARAALEGADAQKLPQVGLMAGVRRGRESSADPKADGLFGGFRASWEVDLFGAKSLASAAAVRDAQGAESAQQATRIVIAADVATAYFEIQALARRDLVSRQAIATLERQIDVARRRYEVGQSSALDIDRLVAELRQEKASVVQLQGEQQARQRQLSALLGEAETWPGLRFADAQVPGVAPRAALLPAELLERRPDVQQRARAVEAAAARLGVAKRDLYPRIEFDWAGRRERLSVQGASASPTLVVGYGVAVSVPIFDGGRIRANIAVHEAQAQEAMAEYEKAMLGALADADIALVQLATADASVAELEQALRAATDASRRSERMFEAGLVGLDTVLDVRRNHLRAQDALVRARGAQWVAAVAVRRAFAGSV